jgi:hypothetical protein
VNHAARRTGAALALMLFAGAAAQGQSITTNFTGESTLLSGRNSGVFFNVTALHPQGITVQGFDVHPLAPAGTEVEIEVFSIGAMHQGHEQVPGGWPLIGRVQVLSAGAGAPTPVPVNGMYIPPGLTRAVYINHVTGGVRFNTAAATVSPVSNSDARLTLGAAQDVLFGGVLLSPRGFMGTVHYTPGDSGTIGACCLPTQECMQTTDDGCTAMGGVYVGVGTYCLSCQQPPACCLPAALGGCLQLQPWQCQALGGITGDWGTTCDQSTYWGSACTGVLHSWGALMTEVGTGLGGAHLGRAMGSNNIAGLDVSAGAGGPHHRLADRFWVFDTAGWRIESIVVYGLIEAPAGAPYASPPQSPFTGGDLNIWDGPPGSLGSAIVASTATMAETGWTGVYRVLNQEEPDDARRPIMFVRMDLGGLHLRPGTYWVDYQLSGMQGSATQAVTPAALLPLRFPQLEIAWGAGRQLVSTPGGAQWTARNWTLPMLITGEVGSAACYANCDGSTTAPILNVDDFTCFINVFAAAQSWPGNVHSYANCDQSTRPPVLNVDDFTCFINAFAQGCR